MAMHDCPERAILLATNELRQISASEASRICIDESMLEDIPWVDFDHNSREFAADPWQVYDELRASCPIAHTDAHDGFWIVSKYADVVEIAKDDATFSSLPTTVIPDTGVYNLIPLQSDPRICSATACRSFAISHRRHWKNTHPKFANSLTTASIFSLRLANANWSHSLPIQYRR